MSEHAADSGPTRPAGQDVPEEELVREVAKQTSSDLKAEEAFRRESGGAVSDAPAKQLEADDLEG